MMVDMRTMLAALVLSLALAACGGGEKPDAGPTPTPTPTHSVAEVGEWAVAMDRGMAWGGGVGDWSRAQDLSDDYCEDNADDMDEWASSIALAVDRGTKDPDAYVAPDVTMNQYLAIAKFSCPERLSVVRAAVKQVKGFL